MVYLPWGKTPRRGMGLTPYYLIYQLKCLIGVNWGEIGSDLSINRHKSIGDSISSHRLKPHNIIAYLRKIVRPVES